MTPAATLLTLSLNASAALLPFASELQQVKVDGTPTVEVRAVSHEVRIAGASARAKGFKSHGVCSHARAEGADLVLTCASGRLHVRVSSGEVAIYLLRGLPWDANDEPPPRVAFLDAGLTGTAAKAEAALHENHIAEAKALLTEALETPYRDYASVRLADLLLDEDKPAEALEHLEKTGYTGEWRRLAVIRICELTDNCPGRAAMFETKGLAPSQRRDVTLRQLRLRRFESTPEAVTQLAEGGTWPEELCTGHTLCEDVLHDALTSDNVDARATALSLFASGPVSAAGPLRPWLARAAADAAVSLGAPQYAAAALGAATPDVPKPELAAHLKRVVQLYLEAGEPARARAVLAYAQDALGSSFKRDAGWKRLHPGAPAMEVVRAPFPATDIELARELAVAAIARSRARETP